MSKSAEDERAYYYALRVLMLAFLKGTSPLLAIEIGRRAVPNHVRPSFQEVETACRSAAAAAKAAQTEAPAPASS